jgi:hypothetical protein
VAPKTLESLTDDTHAAGQGGAIGQVVSSVETEASGSLTKSILRHLFGAAIVARVRATPAIRSVLIEAVLFAVAVGILGRQIIGLPVAVCFSATLVLFAEGVCQVHYANAYAAYKEWTQFRRLSYLTIGLIVGMRLLAGQGLPILSPEEIHAKVVLLGGFWEMFWQGTASHDVLLEVSLDAFLLLISHAAVFQSDRSARRAIAVVVVVSVLMILKPIDWQAADECVVQNGSVGCFFKWLF